MSDFTAAGSGAAGGAVSGAALGSAILPGWGTAIGAVAGGLFGGVTGWLKGGAQDDAIRLKKEQGLEEARVAGLKNQLALGTGTARAAASGIEMGAGAPQSSMALYLNQMAAEFRRQNDLRVKYANQGASLEGQANVWNDVSGIMGSAFNAYSLFGPKPGASK